jgi:hypothetical protein
MCFRGPNFARVLTCFFSLMMLRTRMTLLRTPDTKGLRRLRRIILIYRLPCRSAEIYTPLPSRQTTKVRDSDKTAFPVSELTV